MKIKAFKPDASINITIGVGFLQRLQQVFFYMIQQIPKEKFEEYKKIIESNGELTEEWMHHLTTIAKLLKEIEDKGVEQGKSYDADPSEFTQQ